MGPPAEVRIIPVSGIGEVGRGQDLAKLIVEAAAAQGTPICSGDVLVVTQKVVSKAEGRTVALADVSPSPRAQELAARLDKDPRLVELVLRESRRIVRAERGVLITETRHGFVCANAGVDASNVAGEGYVALLPEDPDASAEGIRRGIQDLTGAEVAVVISDTFGRPWREGHVNVAIGVAGMSPFADYVGQTDPYGYVLRVTTIAVADELAAAAELVMGKLERVPAAIVRGYRYRPGPGRATDMVRPAERDLFR
ncbi:MAG TPA: coenzyme F420-0:L-glutamate ligase [Dehalococcoidia bacterium]|nr:coenzyme F420-0:L-glutamate ligase [Dehalococcoidia bacterium]